jgi:hypothetical protein
MNINPKTRPKIRRDHPRPLILVVPLSLSPLWLSLGARDLGRRCPPTNRLVEPQMTVRPFYCRLVRLFRHSYFLHLLHSVHLANLHLAVHLEQEPVRFPFVAFPFVMHVFPGETPAPANVVAAAAFCTRLSLYQASLPGMLTNIPNCPSFAANCLRICQYWESLRTNRS